MLITVENSDRFLTGPIRYYGLAYVVAYLTGKHYCTIYLRDVTVDPTFYLAIFLAGVASAKLYKVLVTGSINGFGCLGALISTPWICAYYLPNALYSLDVMSVAVPLVSFFIRIANLLNGEIIGIRKEASHGGLRIAYPHIKSHRVPIQLYGALTGLALTFYLLVSPPNQPGFAPGNNFLVVFGVLHITRFLEEFYKDNAANGSYQVRLGPITVNREQLAVVISTVNFITVYLYATIKDAN